MPSRATWERPLALWRRRWGADPAIGLACGLGLRAAEGGVLSAGDPGTLYLAVVTASAALGALAVTPIAIVLALTPGPRLKAIMNHQIDVVRRAMGWAVFAHLLAIGSGVFGLAIDSDKHVHSGLRVITLGLEVAALLALARLVWFFLALLRVGSLDQAAQSA